ncbi:hypothetical protein [Solimonas flava]|uniref:hypothetical protein n=1 Tax=Solimonas flava TaxID=415849 RepID=UPI000410BEB5|nr:hypothetical protein [Solimonas flava]
MPVALFVAYLLFVHLGVLLDAPVLQWLALQALYASVLLAPLRAGRLAYWLAWAGFAVLSWAVALFGGGIYLLYLPPLALSGLACVAFWRSLGAGQVPMVTRVATAVHGTLAPPLAAHTRQVTRLWTVVLAALFVVTLLLTLSGHRQWWAWFTNAGSYAVMGLLFLAEFLYRRRRFPQHGGDSFVGYLRRIAASGVRFR